jgi:hypothetical protein
VRIGEATNTNFIVFGFTRPGLEHTIYRTRGEHANHYTTDTAVNEMMYKFITNNFKRSTKVKEQRLVGLESG